MGKESTLFLFGCQSAFRAKEGHSTSRIPVSPFVPMPAPACVRRIRCGHGTGGLQPCGTDIAASGTCGGCAFSEEIPCSLVRVSRVSGCGCIPLKVTNCSRSPEPEGFPGIWDLQCGNLESLRETGTRCHPNLSPQFYFWKSVEFMDFCRMMHVTHVQKDKLCNVCRHGPWK